MKICLVCSRHRYLGSIPIYTTEQPARMQPNKIECQSVLRQLEMRGVMCDQKMSPYIVDRFSLQYNTEHRRLLGHFLAGNAPKLSSQGLSFAPHLRCDRKKWILAELCNIELYSDYLFQSRHI